MIRNAALSETTSDGTKAGSTNSRPPLPTLPSTPIFPPFQDNADIITGGAVRGIVSHMPWETGMLLYCVEWVPHDVDSPAIYSWFKLSALGYHTTLVSEYHFRHGLEPPQWPPKSPRVRSSTSMAVREIKRTLEERKVYLILRGFFDDDAACEMACERWRIRDEWQRRGRGWGSAIDIVSRRRKEWMEDEHTVKRWRDKQRAQRPAGRLRQRSEPVLGRVPERRGIINLQDELEWREHFPAASEHPLARDHRPLSRVVSTLKDPPPRPALRQLPSSTGSNSQSYGTIPTSSSSLGESSAIFRRRTANDILYGPRILYGLFGRPRTSTVSSSSLMRLLPAAESCPAEIGGDMASSVNRDGTESAAGTPVFIS